MEHLFTRVELSRLTVSEANSRKTDSSVDDLEASITAYGLLGNLVITKDYQVIAGARRLQALNNLADRGELDQTDIPCLIADETDAAAISLAENIVRQSMHPIDEVKAFAACIDAGVSVADIAIQFGCTESLVNQRLRLAAIDDKILNAYRAGEFDMDTLRRFAMTTDQGKQVAVYERIFQHSSSGVSTQYWNVSRAMKEESISLRSDLGRFVGLEDYVNAGGAVTEDLFASQDDSVILLEDVQLVHELADKKLLQAAKARGLKESWGWVEPQADFDYHERAKYTQLPSTDYVLTEAEEKEAEEIECKLGILADSDMKDWTDDDRSNYQEWNHRIEELEDLETDQAQYDPDEMQNAGCVVTIGRNGKVEVVRGLVRDEEGQETAAEKPKLDDSPKPISEALNHDLQMVRTTIMKQALAFEFDACFDLLTFCLAKHILSDYGGSSGLDLEATNTKTRMHSREDNKDFEDFYTTEAEQDFLNCVSALPLDILKSKSDTAFEEFCALTLTARQAIFNTCVAMSLRQQSGEQVLWPENELTMKRLDFEFTGKYQLTETLYWKRLSTPQILAIVEHIFGKKYAREHKSDTKARLAELMHKTFKPGPKPRWLTPAQFKRVRAYRPPGFASKIIRK